MGWWARWTNPEGRRAKREYRRSLPAFYRWRRVIITVGLVVAVALVMTLTGNNPVGYVRNRWRDLTAQPVVLDRVRAQAVGYVAPGYHAERLPAPRNEAWATRWAHDRASPGDCGTTQAAGWFVLRWKHPIRVRQLYVWAGLGSTNPGRQSQFRPKHLNVSYGTDGCEKVKLDDTPDRQEVPLDTGVPVRWLRISVSDVYTQRTEPAKDLVAIGGIELLHFPD